MLALLTSPLLVIPFFAPEPLQIPLPPLGAGPPVLPIEAFGILVMTAVLAGVMVARWRSRRIGIDPHIITELLGHMLIAGFVLGHVLDVFVYHFDVVRMDPWVLLDPGRGLSSFGGAFGAVLGGLFWAWRRGFSFLVFADVVAFAFPFGWIFGRIGCFLAHDHPGRASDFLLAVADYRIEGDHPPWVARHDLGLYEALFMLVLIALFVWLARRGGPRGQFIAWLPVLYAPVRFGLDFLRATDIPHADPRWLGLTPGHYAALVTFTVGLALMHRVFRGPALEIPAAARLPDDAKRA